ncbi:hypothetical protein MRB53_003285 [Persea americana]|uniref:Uncharacterized protein n=1 Tax=Persea americana TaxID=3435 RepID=A0ACC2MWS4_PERAE|nr:hypothetical protein MRB53_003285 [Persea americana]
MARKSSSALLSLLLYLLFLLIGKQHISTLLVDAASNVHIVYMGQRQHDDPAVVVDSHHNVLASVLGSKKAAAESMIYSYKHGFSGFAARLTEAQAEMIAKLPGVVRVIPNRLHKLHTTRSWDYLSQSLNSPGNLVNDGNMGEGIIIGILDTGIWPESESFKDEGLGPIPSRWKGVCETGELFNSSNCNRKLIGARWFIKGFLAELGRPFNTTENVDFMSSRDALGHGTHTSSTAAGSLVRNASYKGLAPGIARGGAPRARLAMYKVCWNIGGGQCASADMLKAFDEAINDGVDVLSLSIGGSVPFFSDVDERDGIATGAFHAVAKGITVVCSAGNSGPFSQTVGNTAPWILTVAASTVDRGYPTSIMLGNNRTILGQGLFAGNKEIGFTGLVYPETEGLDTLEAGACESLSLNGTDVGGKVVLCFTTVARRNAAVSAASVVKEAGGVGVIVAKNPTSSVSSCDDFPCIQVDYEIGTQILYYIRYTRSPVVKLSPSRTLVGKPIATKVAYFSARGPSSIAPFVLKPDVAAPGVNILAASSPLDPFTDNGFAFHTGTSMACPHVTGIVALLKSVHPDWSPAAIKSALVTTASKDPIIAEGPRKLADPFDYGGGIVNPNKAADPGLVYDMGMADYIQYLCSMGYNDSSISGLAQQPTKCPSEPPSMLDLNLASITIPNLRNSVTVSRTVTNVGPINSTYKALVQAPMGVEVILRPSVLAFNSTTKKFTFSVTFVTTHKVQGEYYFGSLSWSDGIRVVTSPISVRTEIIPSYVDN